MKRHLLGLAILFGTAGTAIGDTATPLTLDYSETTVSGLSSGGYMATQFHLAYGDWVKGIGVIAAGPYYCAQNGLLTALGSCVNKQSPAVDLTVIDAYIESQRQAAKLASASAITGDKAWILHGTLDAKVVEGVTNDLVRQYKQWLGDESVRYVADKPFSHHFPTESNGTKCSVSEAPFIGNCGYDAAGEMLNFLLPGLKQPGQANADHLYTFSQREFADGAAMGEDAFVYIPEACQQGEACTLHISFHGCNQYTGAEGVDDHYARMTGLNAWAESNNLVVLYPQTTSSSMMPLNPQGCWDWWGYTNADYATTEGPQIKAVAAMAKALNGRQF